MKAKCKQFNSPYLTTPHNDLTTPHNDLTTPHNNIPPPPFHLAAISTPRQFTTIKQYGEDKRECNMLYRVKGRTMHSLYNWLSVVLVVFTMSCTVYNQAPC